MTVQEARKFLEIIATNLLGDSVSEKNEKLRELMLKEYDAINVAIEVLEKQIPKKPIDVITSDNEFICMICPCCQEVAVEFNDAYCKRCGQKIDWGE